MHIFLIIVFVIVAFTFPRVRMVAGTLALAVLIIMLPGMADDPGAVWALILVGVPFVTLVYIAVRLIAQKEQRQRAFEEHMEKITQSAEKQGFTVKRQFGKFRPRG